MNKTKQTFVLLLLCILPAISYAQKCNLDVDETDAFTKEHVKAGTSKVGPMLWHWKLTLKKTGNKYRWEMQIKYGKHFQDDLKQGDIIYCKLENDKVIKLICDNDYAPSHVLADDGYIVTTYLPQGNLEESDIKDFAESPLSAIRVTLSGIDLEPNISGKQGEEIQNIAQCILKQ